MKLVNRRAVTVWLVVGAGLLSWTGISAAVNAGADTRYKHARQDVAKEQHFWQVVAGKEDGTTGGVLNKLARDLRDTSSRDLLDFRGDSNRYGGISDELGYDPFNGDNCSECGPLDDDVVSNIHAVKTGHLGQVLASLEPAKPKHTRGTSRFAWLVWLVSWPTLAGVALLQRKRSDVRKYRQYEGEMGLIRHLDDAMQELPVGGPRDELLSLRTRLMEGIEHRVKYGQEEKRNVRMQELISEAHDALDAIDAGNRVLERRTP